MAATVVPSTQDMAVSLEQADGDKVNGTDFEIQEYSANDVNGIGVYSYTTKMTEYRQEQRKSLCCS